MNEEEIKKELARLKRYDELLSAVMPKDFKDWHANSKEEWPEIAAEVIKSARKDAARAWEMLDRYGHRKGRRGKRHE